ncbi:MAG: hypothetical protein U1E66_10680 [Rhodospirillales bacterium]
MTKYVGGARCGLVARIGAALVVAGLGVGCASTGGRWVGPTDDPEALAQAQADCRASARADAERTLPDRPFGSPSPSSSQPQDVAGSWRSMMDRYSASNREDTLFQRCMTDRGFRFVPNTP